jgi:prepilin-type N-terminal cleavage/methylation domain-containing protein
MDSVERLHMPAKNISNARASGFTLVETMIAMLILSGGLLALAMAFAQGMVTMGSAHSHQIAKEKASEAIESVFTARDTRIITWSQIRNQDRGGIFLNGSQSLRGPGPDGLINTNDDGSQGIESETLPGPDGRLGTADDVEIPLSGFAREIQITDLTANLRQVRVIVSYQIGSLTRQYQLVSYISSFA